MNNVNVQKQDFNLFKWDVVSKPLYLDEKESFIYKDQNDDYFAIYKKNIFSESFNEEDFICVHKNNYSVLNNHKFSLIVNFLSKLTGMKIHSCSEYNDGKCVMVVLEHSLNINISGFPVKVYFTVMNDFNQDKSLSFGFSLNCNMSGNIFSNISNKIKINDTADLSCIKKDLILMFTKWKNNINKFKKEASLWSSVFFSKNLQIQAVNYMLGIDCSVDYKGSVIYNKDISRLKLSKQLLFMNCLNEQTSVFGNNLWGFLNGVISYNKIKNDNFDFFNLFGLSNRNNQIAYKLCKLNESNSTTKLIKLNIF